MRNHPDADYQLTVGIRILQPLVWNLAASILVLTISNQEPCPAAPVLSLTSEKGSPVFPGLLKKQACSREPKMHAHFLGSWAPMEAAPGK